MPTLCCSHPNKDEEFHHIFPMPKAPWLESRQRRTKGSVVGEEWCQNAAPLRWYTKNVFAQSKMILSRAWLHDKVSCAAWNDARKGVYLKPLFKTPCSNCYWGWSTPIMLDYRDISLMESVPLMWGPVTASPVGIEPMTILEGGAPPPYNWYPIHNGENSMNSTGWPPNTPYDCAEARRTQVADATFRDFRNSMQHDVPVSLNWATSWTVTSWHVEGAHYACTSYPGVLLLMMGEE